MEGGGRSSPAQDWKGSCSAPGGWHTPCLPPRFSATASFAGFAPASRPTAPRVFTARVQGQDLARRGSFNSSPSSPREVGVIPGDANWCSDQGRAVPRDAITDGLGTVASLLPSLLPCSRHSHTRARTHPRPRTSAYMQIANTKRQLSCLLIYDFLFFPPPVKSPF